MIPMIEIQHVNTSMPVFATNISQFEDALRLAAEAIFEEKEKNPKPMVSNVKASYVSDYFSHLNNKKFKPLIDIVLSFCEEVSKTFFKINSKFTCYNCWGMFYEKDDFSVQHNHFPFTFSAIVYIDIEDSSSPIVLEDTLTIIPKKGSLIVFPAMVEHEVPKTQGRRMVVAMNISHIS